jgi:hypothetical protein
MRRTARGGGRVVPMLEVEGCVTFGVSESESVIVYDDASEKIVLHIHPGYHGVDGCGVCVWGGLHQLSLWIALCAHGEADHDHFGDWFFQLGCGKISVEGCPDESSGGLGRVFLSSNSGRLASLVTYLGAGVHGGRRRTQPLLLKCDCGKGKRKDFLSKCRRSLDQTSNAYAHVTIPEAAVPEHQGLILHLSR